MTATSTLSGSSTSGSSSHVLIAPQDKENGSTDLTTMPDLWSRAVLQASKRLKPKDCADILKIQSCDEFIEHVKIIQAKHQNHLSSKLLLQLAPFLGVMKSFGTIIDVFINSNPRVAAIIWGSLKLLVEMTIRSVEVLERLIDTLNDIGIHLPRFDVYAKLFRNEQQLELALVHVYEDIAEFLLGAIRFFRRHPAVNMMRSLWSSFDGEFGPLVRRIKVHREWVEMEAFAVNIVRGERRHEELMKLLVPPAAPEEPVIRKVLPLCHRLVYGPPPEFFGRSDVLQRMQECFAATTTPKTQACFTLSGIGGVGKTQTALRFAYNHMDAYPYIFWLSAETEGKLLHDFQDLAQLLQLEDESSSPTKSRDKVLHRLQDLDCPKWLLVFDNVEKLETLQPFWPKTNTGSIILTTRYTDIGPTVSPNHWNLQPFDAIMGGQMLAKLIGESQNASNDAVEAAQMLGGLPLAIAHVAGFVRESAVTLSEFRDIYGSRDNQMDINALENQASTFQYNRSLSAAWTISIASLPSESRTLLDTIFFLDPDGIPEELFKKGAKECSHTAFAHLKGPVKYLNAIAALQRRSLVQKNVALNAIGIHRIIQMEASRDWTKEIYQDRFEASVDLLNAVFPPHKDGLGMTKFWKQCEIYSPHVQHILGRYKSESSLRPTESFMDILNRCSWYLYERAMITPAVEMAHFAEDLCRSHAPGTLVMADVDTTLACAYKMIGKKEKGVIYAKRALDIRKGLLKPNAIDLANAHNNLGILVNDLNRLEEAVEIHSEAVRIKEANPDCPEVLLAQSYSNLGRSLTRLGRLQEAGDLIEKAVGLRARNFGLNNRYTSVSMYALGNVRLAQNRLEDALSTHIQCLMIRREAMGPTAYYTGLSMHKVAVLRHQQAASSEALDLADQAIAIFRSMPEVKADMARALYNRSIILKALGDAKSSSIAACEARAIYTQLCGTAPTEAASLDDYDVLTAYDNR